MAEPIVTCYRHPDRRAGVTCQRCNRPICPSCMVQASVGFQCPECVHAGARRAPVYTAQTLLRRPSSLVVTYTLIAVNAAVFVAELASGGTAGIGQKGALLDQGYTTAVTVNAARTEITGGVAFGEWYRLVTGGFLHVSTLHILMNMYSLWVLGQVLEPTIGRARYLAIYGTSLLAGSAGVMVTAPVRGAAGASGAIFGLLGATFMLLRSRGINPWSTSLGTVLVINLLLTFTIPYISIGGHIGGLLGGFAVGYAVIEIDKRASNAWPAIGFCVLLSAVLFAVGLLAAGQWANPLLDLGR